MENTGEATTPLGVATEEDKVSIMGLADQDLVYHINRKVVTKEEWTKFHQELNNPWKHKEERVEKDMKNRHDPEDQEEAIGENHHQEDNSQPERTVATLQFPIQQSEGIAP